MNQVTDEVTVNVTGQDARQKYAIAYVHKSTH